MLNAQFAQRPSAQPVAANASLSAHPAIRRIRVRIAIEVGIEQAGIPDLACRLGERRVSAFAAGLARATSRPKAFCVRPRSRQIRLPSIAESRASASFRLWVSRSRLGRECVSCRRRPETRYLKVSCQVSSLGDRHPHMGQVDVLHRLPSPDDLAIALCRRFETSAASAKAAVGEVKHVAPSVRTEALALEGR